MILHSWLASSLIRHYPQTPAQRPVPFFLDAALNERISFQLAVRLEAGNPLPVHLEAQAPEGWSVQARRVGYVPVLHHNTPIEPSIADVDGLGHIPGYVPDPLFDEHSVVLGSQETHAFWITICPGPQAAPGIHEVCVTLVPENGQTTTHTARIRLHPVVLEKRRDFRITHWVYADSLIDWYKTDLFDDRFWSILPRYIRNLVAHGQDTLYVPVFTPPVDGVKRPTQLLRVTREDSGEYAFDWTDVERYVKLAQECGIEYFEWCHLVTQWGCKHAIRVYEGQGREESLLWGPDTTATSETYRSFLSQFLPALHRFLSAQGILDRSFFHISDEPHGDEHLANYRKARAMFQELAPWMQVMDALTEIEFARQGLTDMPIPSIQTALDFVAEDIPCWCYYCCGPRGEYLNRLLDTPLPKIAMHGILFYRWPLQGFLHWGYNYWYESQTRHLIDPYTVQDGRAWQRGWAYGDTFLVYPGADGPVDSMRWEVFGECLQDYQLLQTLGIDRHHGLLAPVHSFADFPKSECWRHHLRSRLFASIEH